MWTKMRRLLMTLPAALLAALLVVQPALAAAPAAKPASVLDIGCEAGVCRFELDLGAAVANALPLSAQVALQVAQSGLIPLPNGASLQVRDNVMLTLPMGTLVLPDADLTVEFGPDRRVVAIHGTALTPVPTFGMLSGLQWVAPARLDVGFEAGANLTDVQAPLDPERRYFHMSLEAGLSAVSRGEGPGLQLEAPSGQHVTLLVDPLQPLLYIDGQVSLRYLGDLAFVRELVDPAEGLAWWPTGLVLPQTIELNLNGVVGQGVMPNLEMRAGYRVDSGIIGQWLRLDGALVEAEGSLVLGPDGLLLAGKANSALVPEALAESAAMAQLYIPFGAPQAELAAPQIDTQAASPGVEAVAQASLDTTGADDLAGPRVKPNRLASMAESTLDGLQTGAGVVAATTQASYGAVVQGAGVGFDWMAGAVADGVHYTNQQWCGLTRLCVAAAAEEQTTGRVARAAQN